MNLDNLYYKNPYQTDFTARVLDCRQEKTGYAVTLSQTCFYPEGGGQPGDTGILGEARVTDTRERDGAVVHLCDKPLEVGAEVEGSIDWERRFDLMQQHSGEHIVSGLIYQKYGYHNVGFHLGAEYITIDLDGELDMDDLAEIEAAANQAVMGNVPVDIFCPSAEELRNLEYRSKKELTGTVRIVRFPGSDACACCGTHVNCTGEIGLIKLCSCVKFHQGVRVEMVCGKRAIDYVNLCVRQNREIMGLLSAKLEETAQGVRRLLEENTALKQRITAMETERFAAVAAGYAGAGNVVHFEPGLSPDGVRRLCDAILQVCGGRCAVFSGEDGAGYKYAVGEKDGDLRQFVRELNGALNGRGGGKPFFAEGSVQADRADIAQFFA